MIAFLQTLAAFCAIICFSLFAARFFKISSGLTPLIVISATLVYFSLFGVLNLLPLGGALFYSFATILALIMLIRPKAKGAAPLISLSFLMFAVSGFALLILLAARQPVFSDWDEFSFWGTAAKICSIQDKLYTDVVFGWPWPATQKPGFIALSYFFNYFGEFMPWRTYFAYDILMLSVFTAIISCVRFKKWYIGVCVFATAMVLPFINIYTRMIYFTTPYLSAYADIPMGILTGGVFALYYSFRENKNSRLLFALLPILSAITLCKDTGLPLALLAAAVISVDMIMNEPNKTFVLFKFLKGIRAKLALMLSFIAVIGITFFTWSKYLLSFGVDTGNLGGSAEMNPVQMILNGVLLLFGQSPLSSGIGFEEKFTTVFNNMIDTFLYSRVTLFGTGVATFAVIMSILLISRFLSNDKLHRSRVFTFGVFGILSFIPYYVFIGFTYVFIFKGEQGVALIDYNRYVGCYYAALLVGALTLFVLGALKPVRIISLARGTILFALGMLLPCAAVILSALKSENLIPHAVDVYVPIGIMLILLFAALYGQVKAAYSITSFNYCVFVILLFISFVPLHLSIVDYPKVVYDEFRQTNQNAKRILQATGEGKRIFFVDCDDVTGEQWFRYSYELYPAVLDYSYGGGDFADASTLGIAHVRNVPLKAFAAYLYESDCEYVYVNSASEAFSKSYSSLFASPITRGLYKIEKTEGGMLYDAVIYANILPRNPSQITDQVTIRNLKQPEKYLSLVLTSMEVLE